MIDVKLLLHAIASLSEWVMRSVRSLLLIYIAAILFAVPEKSSNA
jgi:hypothetical protein